ncbi:hypothetical protein Hanom_Chr14g01319141 [Helianthus anomalus]
MGPTIAAVLTSVETTRDYFDMCLWNMMVEVEVESEIGCNISSFRVSSSAIVGWRKLNQIKST